MIVSFLLYFCVCLIYAYLSEKVGVERIDDVDWVVLAILTAAESISMRSKK